MKKFLSNYYLIILTIVVGILALIFQFGFQLNLVSLILIHSCAAIFVVITVVSMIKDLIQGHVGLDILALTSIISTLFVNDTINGITIEGYWACLMIMIMMASGQALESFSSRKANKELTELINKTPKVVHLLTDSGYCMDIDIKEAKIGDLFLIKPNETVPLDSTIIDGNSPFNMSSLTGESIPESKKAGDKILSGFINGDSPIIAKVDKKDADSQYQTIVKLAKEVDKKPSKFVKMTDKLAIPFTIVSYLLAGLGWLIAYITNPSISLMDGFTRFVEVLVVASPCPLLLAAPIAMISGISQAYKKNILIKDPIAFEKLANTKTFAFDKTGTLTIGKPSISKIETIDDYSKDDLLLYMASLEINSNHIFAKSIIKSSNQTNLLKASDIKEYPGKGVEGFIDGVKYKVGNRSFVSLDDNIEKGETLVGLSVNDNPVGYIIFRDNGAADKSRVVVGHVEREAGARGVKAVLALDGQRQLGLVAGQAQRQQQLDPAAVELRHRERVIGCGAAGGLDDGALKGAAQQQRVALPPSGWQGCEPGSPRRPECGRCWNGWAGGSQRRARRGPQQSARGTAGTQTRPAWGRFP